MPRCLRASDFYSVPEGNTTPDALRGRPRVGIVPGSIHVARIAHLHRVIARRTFPGTDRVRRARLEEFHAQAVGWKVMIALDLDGAVTHGEYRAFPDRFHGFQLQANVNSVAS